VAIEAGDRWLVLDAGTGLRRMSDVLGPEPLRGSLLLTHLHWDHTQGLPFLPNADRPDAEVTVYLPQQVADDGTTDPLTVLSRGMSPPHFPITAVELQGRWRVRSIDTGRHQIEGLTVTAAEVTHKGGRTFGYRIDDGSVSVAYVPDHSPAIATPEQLHDAIELARGADVLIHDSQFLAHERGLADLYGHSTIEDAVGFAAAARVRELVLFHHAPARVDDDVDGAVQRAATAARGDAPLLLTIGREGDELHRSTAVPTPAGVSTPPSVHR
jgi:ribonuclease BN (tRNA processing enzyme)